MQGKDTLEEVADAAAEGTSRIRSAIERGGEELKRGAQHIKERAGAAVDSARQHVADVRLGERRVGEMVEDAGALIQRHPGKAVLAALLVGTVLGSLLTRRRD